MPMHLNETPNHSIVSMWFREPHYEMTTKILSNLIGIYIKTLFKEALGDNDL